MIIVSMLNLVSFQIANVVIVVAGITPPIITESLTTSIKTLAAIPALNI
jgi:hypothetical protein